MNILVVPSWYKSNESDQIGSFFYEQAIMLKEYGHNVVVADATLQGRASYFSKRLFRLKKYDDGVLTYSYVVPSLGTNRIEFLAKYIYKRSLKKIVKALRKDDIKIDIVHAHSFFPAGLVSTELFERQGIPVVVTEHNSLVLTKSLNKRRLSYLQETLDNCSAFICVSEALKKAVMDQVLVKKEINVVPNVVSNVFYYRNSPNREGAFTFISIGNLIKSKNHSLTIQAFSKFSKVVENSSLYIVGEGIEHENLLLEVDKLGLKDKVVFTGCIGRQDVAEIISKSNVLVLPSSFETFGVVYIESLACGRPVIAAHNGGADEIITNDNGLFVKNIDVDSIFDSMVTMYDMYNTFDYYDISVKAIEEYGAKSIASQLSGIYNAQLS